ncbi:excalibur calcium-binding domain-containing protein [Saccharomonospora sp. NPDC046836]|uniref:excalibur calcium-binding domain-containing protein n=1 Tax=Saccharomonospora sp. NPDC046836 TaxID=3156921 RepID=UPI0033D885E0
MIENSSSGLVMLRSEVTVVVTREEHHQPALARYAVPPGGQRRVAVELGWCVIGSGKYRGESAIEVRLDGVRIGELTFAMSQRYGPLLAQVSAQSGRAGCEALIQEGRNGLEAVLRLPKHTGEDTVPMRPVPAPAQTPLPTAAMPAMERKRRTIFSSRPAWIAATIAVILVIAALAGQDDDSPPSSTAADLTTATTTRPPTTQPSSTRPTTTTPPPTTTTTTVAPAAPPPPAPRTTTRPPAPQPPPPPAPPEPEPAPEPEPEPEPQCDPNYSGCVPVASDVDCAGGSGDGPAYVTGPIRVIGTDIYDLDRDGDGIACE